MRKMSLRMKELIEKKFGSPADELIELVFSTPNEQLTAAQRKFKTYYLCWVRDVAIEDLKALETQPVII